MSRVLRTIFARLPGRLVLWLVLAGAIVALALFRPGNAPAGSALLVNSAANTSDGTCDSTSCTLREAIDAANAGANDAIAFDPAVFPPAVPAVINLEGGEGALPAITDDLSIDATGAGVVLDGNGNNDSTELAAPGLAIVAAHDEFSFSLIGDGAFTIREITGRGIDVQGNGFSVDMVAIDAITIMDNTSHGVFISNTPFARDVSVTNSTLYTGNTGVGAVLDGPDIPSLSVDVSNNDIDASLEPGAFGAAVLVHVMSALVPGSTAAIAIDDNTRLRTGGSSGVRIAHCSIEACGLDGSRIQASVSRNGQLTANGDALQVRISADDTQAGSSNASIEFDVRDNGPITGTSDAIDIASAICCGSANAQAIVIEGNGAIGTAPRGSDALDLELRACCAPGSGVEVAVSGNDGLLADEGEALQLLLECCGDNTINIHDNAMITSGNDNGIHIMNCVEEEFDPQGSEVSCLQQTTTVVNITDNTISDNVEDGIHICCGAFERPGERSVIADNVVTTNAKNGMLFESVHGITVGPGNIITDNGHSGDDDNNGLGISNVASVFIFDERNVVSPASGITVTRNEIQRNKGLGIDLAGFAQSADPTLPSLAAFEFALVGCNPFGLASINPNDCLAAPTISGVAAGEAQGQACGSCVVEVFLANAEPPDQPGPGDVQHGEGAVFLASGSASAGGSFSLDLPCGLAPGALTATATDGNGNTSEFSANVAFAGTPGAGCTPTATPTPPPVTSATPTSTMPFTPAPSQTQAATNTPTRTPTPGITPTVVVSLCGDVDGNGSVNSIDAALVLQYTAGLLQTLVEPQNADANGDGDINSIDAALILQHGAGLLDQLSC